MRKVSKIVVGTVREAVEHIGRKELADALSLADSKSIQPAISEGLFPASWYLEVNRLGNERDIEVPDRLFKWKNAPVDAAKRSQTAA